MAKKNLRNVSGRRFENTIDQFLNENNFNYKREAYVGYTLFGKRFRADFVIYFPSISHVVECKHQVTSGTVEEKLLYTAHSMLGLHEQFTNVLPVLLISGGGYSKGCVEYMRDWSKDKDILVTSPEFYLDILKEDVDRGLHSQKNISENDQ